MTNNETIHEYTIKLKGDGVYDVYVDGVHMCSKGSYQSSLKELEVIMVEVDEYKLGKNK
jgi:hypothetical protein